MRNPEPEEMAPLYALAHELEEMRSRHAAEQEPVVRRMLEAKRQLAERCGVSPGAGLDELARVWVHPVHKVPLVQ